LKVPVEIKGRKKEVLELPEGALVTDVLKKLEINRETVVVFINGRAVPEEERINEGSELTILPIVTGG